MKYAGCAASDHEIPKFLGYGVSTRSLRAIQRLSMASGTNELFPIDTETLKDVVWDASAPQEGRKGKSLTEVNKPHTTVLGIYMRTYT